MEVELLVGVDIVPDPGQQDQVEETLGHLLLQVRREDACRLHTQTGKYITRGLEHHRTWQQCCGSMTFWCGSGSADPCL